MATTIVLLLAAALVWHRLGTGAGAQVISDPSTRHGWQTIGYEAVRVDIPVDWRRSDMDGCELQFEHWGPPGAPACGRGAGVAFYASATFDPADGPGVRRADDAGTHASPAWGGYVTAGDFAVYASNDRRDVVQDILRSVRVR